jgi:hypothetical protein
MMNVLRNLVHKDVNIAKRPHKAVLKNHVPVRIDVTIPVHRAIKSNIQPARNKVNAVMYMTAITVAISTRTVNIRNNLALTRRNPTQENRARRLPIVRRMPVVAIRTSLRRNYLISDAIMNHVNVNIRRNHARPVIRRNVRNVANATPVINAIVATN